MNWEAAGTIVEGIGVIAVVATLFYVGVQIRQSTAQTRRAEMNANLEQASLFRLALAENQDLAELWVAGLNNYDPLSDAHKVRFESLMAQRFWIWSHIFDRMTKGPSWSGGHEIEVVVEITVGSKTEQLRSTPIKVSAAY
jgi:hypothetical protein